jgi:hypothetical protein
MANFFFLGAQSGFDAINLDQVRQVIHDNKVGKVAIYFDHDHKIELAGDMATDFVDVLTRLKSEAGIATEAMKHAKTVKGTQPAASAARVQLCRPALGSAFRSRSNKSSRPAHRE